MFATFEYVDSHGRRHTERVDTAAELLARCESVRARGSKVCRVDRVSKVG